VFTYFSLKFVRTENSRIIRGYDYALPNDKDINKLLQTGPERAGQPLPLKIKRLRF